MIVAFAGRRVDAPGAVPRFPLANVNEVTDRIRQALADLDTGVGVGAAACGADLCVIEAAASLGWRRRIVLPFAPERFRVTSVVDRPGDWGARFDRAVADAAAAGDLVVLEPAADPETSYALANQHIVAEALALSRGDDGLARPDQVRALVVWEGTSRGPDDLTADFLAAAGRAGVRQMEVRTL